MAGKLIKGRALKYGDNINTDFINPAQYMELSLKEMTRHAMEGVDPEFSQKVRPGDILVAGKNFGSGSSRETAPLVIRESGVAAVVAEFFARIFYRNAINIGLPLLMCDSVSQISHGNELKVDLLNGAIFNVTTKEEYKCSSLPDNIIQLVEDGGLISHLKKQAIAIPFENRLK